MDDNKKDVGLQAVIEIDPNKKYILYFSQFPHPSELERLKAVINEWLQSNNPILVLCGYNDNEVKLVKVE